MDGVDAVLCDICADHINTIAAASVAFDEGLLATLHQLCAHSANEVNLMGQADRDIAYAFHQAVEAVLKTSGIKSSDIVALGSHGQTIRHFPTGLPQQNGFATPGFTLQIGDPHTLAVLSSIDVVADFRRKDIALGGQGAPLVPAFHRAVFGGDVGRAVVNIGGIANISVLPADTNAPIIGFDTGPGNTLMDVWCRKHTGNSYDADGAWAASGVVHAQLLSQMLEDKYFALPYPKSTGREYFHSGWLYQFPLVHQLSPQDVQATLLALTTHSICNAINLFPSLSEVYICGGGAFNLHLMQTLRETLLNVTVSSTDTLGLHPQHVEGAAFAWLAWAFVNRHPGNVPSVTGASREAVLGTLTPAQ